MSAMNDFFNAARDILSLIELKEGDKIRQVAELMSESIMNGGIPHVFGSGHSMLPAREVFKRAGTLSCIRAIGMERWVGKFERVEGFGTALLKEYDMREGEILIVISSSGINPLPLEIAMRGKEIGMKVVALTALEHSASVTSRHSSGKKLDEVADIVIDLHLPIGDAAIEIEGIPMKVGPLSTISGVGIMNAIVAETAQLIVKKGGVPPVRISRNLPGGDENNRRFKEMYGARIPDL